MALRQRLAFSTEIVLSLNITVREQYPIIAQPLADIAANELKYYPASARPLRTIANTAANTPTRPTMMLMMAKVVAADALFLASATS